MSAIPKRTFYSLVIVLLWLGFVVDGAHAIFSSAASLEGNTITSGTATLLISNDQGLNPVSFADSQAGFTYNLTPGETDDRYVYLRNTSNDNVDFDLYLTASGSGGGVNQAWFSSVTVGMYPVDSSGQVSDSGFVETLSDLSNASTTGFVLPHNATERFLIRTTLASTWGQQNASTTYDLMFTGMQHLAG